MKKLLMLISTFMFFTCNAIGGDEYEIKGKITNTKSKSVYLEKLTHTESRMIDSSVIKNGEFSLKGNIDGPGFYRIKIKEPEIQGEIYWFLSLNKGEKVTANLDALNIEKYDILGHSDQKDLQDIVKAMTLHQKDMAQMYQQYQTFMAKDPNSKEATNLSGFIQAKTVAFDKYLTGVIQTTKAPIAKYYLYSILLQQYQGKEIPDQLIVDIKSFTNSLTENMPNSLYTKDFQAITSGLEQQKLASQSKAKLDVGAQAPDIDLAYEDGKKVKLSSFKGKVVLMDFWASWCRPCRMENPNVVAAYNKFKDKGFVVLSISQDQDLVKWNAAIKQDNLSWKTHFADKLTGSMASTTYDIQYIPKTYLLDKNGKIAAKDIRGHDLEVEISKLIK